jgi:hypothetical protein
MHGWYGIRRHQLHGAGIEGKFWLMKTAWTRLNNLGCIIFICRSHL